MWAQFQQARLWMLLFSAQKLASLTLLQQYRVGLHHDCRVQQFSCVPVRRGVGATLGEKHSSRWCSSNSPPAATFGAICKLPTASLCHNRVMECCTMGPVAAHNSNRSLSLGTTRPGQPVWSLFGFSWIVSITAAGVSEKRLFMTAADREWFSSARRHTRLWELLPPWPFKLIHVKAAVGSSSQTPLMRTIRLMTPTCITAHSEAAVRQLLSALQTLSCCILVQQRFGLEAGGQGQSIHWAMTLEDSNRGSQLARLPLDSLSVQHITVANVETVT